MESSHLSTSAGITIFIRCYVLALEQDSLCEARFGAYLNLSELGDPTAVNLHAAGFIGLIRDPLSIKRKSYICCASTAPHADLCVIAEPDATAATSP